MQPAMHFAFNNAIHPEWDLPAVPVRAKELGYDSVEVFLPQPTADNPAAGSIVAERELVHLAFEQAGIKLAGISASIGLNDEGRGDEAALVAIRRIIDLAHRLKSPAIRLLDATVRPGRNQTTAALRFAQKLLALADQAAAANTTLLIQNAITFRTAPAMWRLIEQVNHPAVACAWDPLSAAAAGEDPTLSVPVLNSRIRHVVLRDAAFELTGTESKLSAPRQMASLSRVGDGDLHLAKTLERLRGIGFTGNVVVTYPPTLPDGVGPAEALLKHAIEKLKGWMPAPAKPTPAGKKPLGKTVAA